jgi:DinB superfamily
MSMTGTERQQRIEQYDRGPHRLHDALRLVPDGAVKWRPAPGKWSAHEVICHCADSETNGAMRLRYLLAEKDPVIVGYDQEAWARIFDYHSRPLETALALVEAVRANTAALLRSLGDEAWSRAGRHSESGPYSVETWLRIYSDHLEGHARQIERNVEAWRSGKPYTPA